MYFFDTDTCIEFLRGNLPHAQSLMKSVSPKQFGIPSVVAAELYFGAENSAFPAEEKDRVERFLAPFQIVAFDEGCIRNYAAIRFHLKKQGCMIGPNDLLIAATALSHGAVLVTNNASEFQRVRGLIIESWEEVRLPE